MLTKGGEKFEDKQKSKGLAVSAPRVYFYRGVYGISAYRRAYIFL
jgi:hypothetical protein